MPPVSPTVHLAQPTLIAHPFHREGWVYEEKVDGYRMVAYKSAGKVKLISRNGRDYTQRFAGIAEAIRLIPESTLVLDGEVAIYDQRLVSRFEWMGHHAPPELGDSAAVYGVRLRASRAEGPAPESALRSAEHFGGTALQARPSVACAPLGR